MDDERSRADDDDVTEATGGAARAPAMLPRGSLVSRYVVLDRIGRGAMGAVYAAYDPELDRRIALKLLHEARPNSVGVLREAQALARLSHPNVVAVHDAGRHAGRVFVAMDHVVGTSLRTWLERGGRDREAILDAFIAAGRGLAAAHAAGIVHRDFKPDNVLVGVDGSVRVADFGIAELSEPGTTAEHANVVASAPAAGTPAYMAPEQRLGLAVDARADQYAFCVALFEALAGERPFDNASLASLAGVDVAAKLPETTARRVPTRVRAVLRVGLANAPADRHPDMNALLAELADARRSRLQRMVAPALAAAAVAGVGAATWAWQDREKPCDRADTLADAIWGDAQRERLAVSLGGGAEAYAAATVATTTATLDAWIVRWRGQWRDACEATHERGIQSVEELALREACLDSGRSRADAVIDLLSNGDGMAEHAVDQVLALPDPEVCGDLGGLRERVPPPDTQAMAQRVREIRDDIERARALDVAPRPAEAVALAEQVVRDADETGYLPVRAEAHTLMSDVLQDDRRRVGLLLEAIALASRVGHDTETIRALISLIASLRSLGQLDEAKRWASLADAMILRSGDPARQRLALTFQLAEIAVRDGDSAAAVEHAEATMALVESNPALAGLRGEAHASLSSAWRTAGDYPRVLANAEAMHAFEVELVGTSHPDTLRALQMVAIAKGDLGDVEGAIVVSERLAEQLAASAQAPRVLRSVRSNLGVFLAAVGRFDEARVLLAEVESAAAEHAGVESRDHAEARSNRGVVELRAGNLDAARALTEDADAIYARVAPGQPATGLVKGNLADIALAQGRLTEARDTYVTALGLVTRGFGESHPIAVELASHLAHVEARLGDGAAAWARIEPLLAVRNHPRPLRAMVLADATLIARLTADPRLPALRHELEQDLAALGAGARWVRDDLARWDRVDAPARSGP